ncbi:MAG: tetraacyldisaccharide 4'-kinase, partial [Candidatus Omnitrophota bacterium]|nr:tetraacyldisaccharide 4'-kinase [Candidatus Omnitrophota bacterium]
HFIFRDHQAYKKVEFANIVDYCVKIILYRVVTTEKDAVKLKGLGQKVKYLVLKVRLEIIENEQGFYNRLFGIYNS